MRFASVVMLCLTAATAAAHADEAATTTWPALPPCAHPTRLTTASEFDDDLVVWSSASGAQQSLTKLGDATPRALSAAFAGEHPTRLAWRERRPPTPLSDSCRRDPRCAHELDLAVTCEDGFGQIAWHCSDRPLGCSAREQVAYGSATLAKAHRGQSARVRRALKDAKEARNLVIGYALQLATDACRGERCSDAVANVVAQLRAVAAERPWTVVAADAKSLQVDGSADVARTLRCSDSPSGQSCELELGNVSFRLAAPTGIESIEEHNLGWYLMAQPAGFALSSGAYR